MLSQNAKILMRCRNCGEECIVAEFLDNDWTARGSPERFVLFHRTKHDMPLPNMESLDHIFWQFMDRFLVDESGKQIIPTNRYDMRQVPEKYWTNRLSEDTLISSEPYALAN